VHLPENPETPFKVRQRGGVVAYQDLNAYEYCTGDECFLDSRGRLAVLSIQEVVDVFNGLVVMLKTSLQRSYGGHRRTESFVEATESNNSILYGW
jgi:hypothetical protein